MGGGGGGSEHAESTPAMRPPSVSSDITLIESARGGLTPSRQENFKI